MNSRRIIAAVLLVIIVIMIIYPSLSVGSVSVRFDSKGTGSAEHLYVTLSMIRFHDSDFDNQTGWTDALNKTVTLDLIDQTSLAASSVKIMVRSGHYDKVSIHVDSASLVLGSNKTDLALSSDRYVAQVPLLLKFAEGAQITLKLGYNISAIQATGIFDTVIEATNS
jgi:hypothetical protein